VPVKDEFDMALLVKHISPRLLFALNKTEGIAAEKIVRRHFESIPRFMSCAIDLEISIIARNFQIQIFDSPVPKKKCLWHFALDGVACEELFARSSSRRSTTPTRSA
jgi:hypothetical protein